MFDGVGAKAVNAVVTNPLRKPGDEIVAHGRVGQFLGVRVGFRLEQGRQADGFRLLGLEVGQIGELRRQVVAPAFFVAAQAGADPVRTPPLQPRRVVVVDEAVVVVELGLFPARPEHAGLLVALRLLDVLAERLQVAVAGVIHHDVEQHANALGMRRLDERVQLVGCAHVAVQERVVEREIAVVGVVFELFLPTHHPTVRLFVRRGDPDRIDAEVLEPAFVEFLRQAGEVPAVKRADIFFGFGLAASPVAAVVCWVAVEEAVGDREVDDRVVGEAAGHADGHIGLVLENRQPRQQRSQQRGETETPECNAARRHRRACINPRLNPSRRRRSGPRRSSVARRETPA